MPIDKKKIVIRNATIKDIPAIVEIHKSAVKAWVKPEDYENSSIKGRFLQGGSWLSPETCAVHLNNLALFGGIALVCLVDDRVLGEIEFFIGKEVGPFLKNLHVSVLFVLKEARGKGIGSALIKKTLDIAKKNKCNFLTTVPEDEAVAFYKKNGFKELKKYIEVSILSDNKKETYPFEKLPSLNKQDGKLFLFGRVQSSSNIVFILNDIIYNFTEKPFAFQLNINGKKGTLALVPRMDDKKNANVFLWLDEDTNYDKLKLINSIKYLAVKNKFKKCFIIIDETFDKKCFGNFTKTNEHMLLGIQLR